MRDRKVCIGVLSPAALGSVALLVVLAVHAVPAWPGHDNTPPQTYINRAPAKRTTDKTPRFTFSSNDRKARFVCKRDGKSFSPCDSPKTLKPLSYGRHGFYVRAIDPFANKDPTAAAYTFKVVKP